MSSTYDFVYDRVDKKLGKYRAQLLNQLPYNPQVLKNAFQEIQRDSGTFQSWGEVFRGDPSLQTRFLYEANLFVKSRRKEDWRIHSMVDAVKILGQKRTVEILEKALADELLENFKKIDYKEYELIWHECHYMAAIGRNLAPFFNISEPEGYSLCLLANIGHIILAQIFETKYLYAIIKNEQRLLNANFNMIDTERQEFDGITHSDVGYWFMTFLGMGSEFATAAYRHELPDPEQLKSIRHQLVVYANQISNVLTRQYLIEHLITDVVDDSVVEELEINNNKQRLSTIKRLQSKFGYTRESAAALLDKAKLDVLRLTDSKVTSQNSILKQGDYVKALEDLANSRNEILDKMLSTLDLSITKYLPYPLAVDYARLLERSERGIKDGLEILALITSIAENYTTILNCTTLAYLQQIRPEALLDELMQTSNDKKSAFFLSMGGGVGMTQKIFKKVASEIPEEKLPRLIRHFISNTDLIYRICESRAKTKNTSAIVDLKNLVDNIHSLLRDFALQQSEYLAVTDLEFIETPEKQEFYRCEYISWSGTESMEARSRSNFRSPKGFPKGSQMLILREFGDRKANYRLPKFLVFRSDLITLRNYFFSAKQIFIHSKANKITISMEPFNADSAAKNRKYTFDLPETE